MCVIHDPLGQTHIHDSSDHYSSLKFVLFCENLKSGDGRTYLKLLKHFSETKFLK